MNAFNQRREDAISLVLKGLLSVVEDLEGQECLATEAAHYEENYLVEDVEQAA